MDFMLDAQPLDSAIEIVTPENIAFRYQLAGPFRRLPAYLIDLLIRGMLSIVALVFVVFVFGGLGLLGMGLGLWLVFWFLLAWFYGGLFEALWNGQTPGKRLMQIRVLSVDGRPINGLQAVLRNVLRTVDQQPGVFCVVGLVAAAMSDRFQRLGDLACGTMVVVEEPHWFRGVIRFSDPEAIRLAGQIPAGFQASRTLARALAVYVQRRKLFSQMRRMEIARHVAEPLRERFGLPAETDPDLLLCGVYQRSFITDWEAEASSGGGSPFGSVESPGAPSDGAPRETVEAVIVSEQEDEKKAATDAP